MNILLIVAVVFFLLIFTVGLVLLIWGIASKRRGLWIAGLVGVVLSVLACSCSSLAFALVPAFSQREQAPMRVPPADATVPVAPEITPFEKEENALPTEEPGAAQPGSEGEINPAAVLDLPAWLIATNEAVWAARPDGTLTPILDQQMLFPERIKQYISPTGGYLAYVTSTDDAFFTGLILNLLSFEDGRTTVISPLTTPATEPGDDTSPGEPAFEAVRAITEGSGLAWSPDGQYLAFTAAFEGPVAQLFVYSIANGSITRLSDHEANVIHPAWSPDSRLIFYTTVNSLGTGAGFSMDGAYVVDVDMAEVTASYDASDYAGESLLGWTENDLLLLASWQADCGVQNLRSWDIASGDTVLLWEGCFNDSATAIDPATGGLLFSVPEDFADWNEDQTTGIAWADANTGELDWLSDDSAQHIAWWEGPDFFSVTSRGSIQTISSQAEMYAEWECPLPDCSPIFSLVGPSWAVRSSYNDELQGVWSDNIGSDGVQVYENPVLALDFIPDTEDLLILSEEGLFVQPYASPAEKVGDPSGIENEDVFGAAWVNP